MPYKVPLSAMLRKAGWRAAIYDAEGPEKPHVSIYRRTAKWRISLRTGEVLDGGTWRDIDHGVKEAIEADWENLKAEWDKLHGRYNPISSNKAE